MILLKLALRNIFRNLRRTLITVAAIAGGLALMITSNNLAFGSYSAMIRAGVSAMAGHVVVQAKGWQEERDLDLVVPQAAARAAELRALRPDAVVVPRMFFPGLLSSPQNSIGIMLTAIDPTLEPLVSDWQDKLAEGEFLSDDRGILLGAGLAESLQVETGGKVVLMSQGDEDVSSRLFRVRGLIKTGGKDIDGFFAMITVPAAQALLGTPDAVHQLSVHLPDPDDTPQAVAQIAEKMPADLEVLGWKDALPELYQMIQLDRQSSNTMMGIIGFIVALGVLNTVLMSVMERMREFGVMLAIGTSPRFLVRLILLEGAVLGVISVAVGVMLGMLASWPLIVNGLDYSKMMGEGFETAGVTINSVVYAMVDWERLIIFSVCGVVMALLAAIYPAWKVAHLHPIESMRHV